MKTVDKLVLQITAIEAHDMGPQEEPVMWAKERVYVVKALGADALGCFAIPTHMLRGPQESSPIGCWPVGTMLVLSVSKPPMHPWIRTDSGEKPREFWIDIAFKNGDVAQHVPRDRFDPAIHSHWRYSVPPDHPDKDPS